MIFSRSLPSTGRVALVALGVACMLAGCQPSGSSAEAARGYFERGDFAAAKVEAKAVLSQNPGDAAVRLLLARSLMELGDEAAAVQEFERAREAHAPEAEVIPELLSAYLDAAQADKVVAQFANFSSNDPKVQVKVLAALALAHAQQGDMKAAQAAADKAVALKPDDLDVQLLRARLLAQNRQHDEALALVDQALAGDPKAVQAWLLKGDLLRFVRNDAAGAMAAYRKALELKPRALKAHTAALGLALAERQFEQAKPLLEELKKQHPTSVKTVLFEAELLQASGEHARAAEKFNAVLTVLPDQPKVLIMAAANDMQMGALTQAEAKLGKVLLAFPGAVDARRLMARLHLRQGQPAKALEIIKPLIAEGLATPSDLYIGASAAMATGDAAKFDEWMKKAAQAAPKDAQIQTALALRKLGSGQTQEALQALNALSASEGGEAADLALIGVRLQRKEFDQALKSVAELEKKRPQEPLVADLKGQVLLAQRDTAGARAAFDKALTLSPSYFPALARLVMLDRAQNQPQEAIKRLEAFVKAAPQEARALLMLAGLKASMGASTDELTALYREGLRLHPTSRPLRLALLEHLLARHKVAEAMEFAQQIQADAAKDPQMLDALGRAMEASGDHQRAMSLYNQVLAQNPNAALPLMRIARVHAVKGDSAQAAKYFRRAYDAAPKSPAQQQVIRTAMEVGKADVALGIAQSLQKERPADPQGFALEGDIHSMRQQWLPAAKAYDEALRRAPAATPLAIKLHSVLIAGDRRADADKLASMWLQQRPKDVDMLFHLGSLAVAEQRYDEAQKRLDAAGAIAPGPGLWNNVAWMMASQKKPGAVAMAQKAVDAAPQNPQYLDTLAAAHASEGQWAKAVETQRLAIVHAAEPTPSALNLNLARWLIQAGDKAGAAEELKRLAEERSLAPALAEAAKKLAQTLN